VISMPLCFHDRVMPSLPTGIQRSDIQIVFCHAPPVPNFDSLGVPQTLMRRSVLLLTLDIFHLLSRDSENGSSSTL
jgi:hypothetical protein